MNELSFSHLICEFDRPTQSAVKNFLACLHILVSGTCFIVYERYTLRNGRNFKTFDYEGKRCELPFACRNFVLEFGKKVISFRVFLRFVIDETRVKPLGIMSFEGESKPKNFLTRNELKGRRKTMATKVGDNYMSFEDP